MRAKQDSSVGWLLPMEWQFAISFLKGHPDSLELESPLEHCRVTQRVRGPIQQVVRSLLALRVCMRACARTCTHTRAGLLASLRHYWKCIPGPEAGHGHCSPLGDDPPREGRDLQDNRECLVEDSSLRGCRTKSGGRKESSGESQRAKLSWKGVLKRKEEQREREKHQL